MSASVPPSAGAAVAASTDPNYSSSGFHLRERQPLSKIKYLSPVAKPDHPIGKPFRPMQLQGPDDATDPYITAEASALGHDPQQIFNFLRNGVGYQAYAGSLRGARGTLWSLAGNALDRASLLVALLKASGYTTQYVQGTLTQAQAQPLILPMFAGAYRFVGCLPAGLTAADPANDPTLLGIAENHYWVEYASSPGGPFTDADPSFPNSQLGQTYGAKTTTFQSIFNNQASVTFEIDAETYSQASAAFAGNGITTNPVLYQSYYTSQLVGKPVSVGQFVSSNAGGGLAISATTNTYSPYLLIGEDPTNPANDDTITGTPVQEILTNFPLGSTVLTGLFLTITVTDANGNATTYQKVLYDAIGYAARTTGNVQVTVNPGQAPALSTIDFTTINVSPSRQDQSILTTWSNLSDSLTAQLQPILAQLPSNPNAALTPAQTALQQQADLITNELAVNTQRGLTGSFSYLSDLSSTALANESVVTEYLDSPRLIVSTSFAQANSSGGQTLQIGFDLLKDDVQVLLPPGQSNPAAPGYRIDRGLIESYLEGKVLSQLASSAPSGANASVYIPGSATDILAAAQQQGIGLVVITASTLAQLSALNISAEAQARITQSIEAGNIVEVPSQAVIIGGVPQIGWLEFQPDGTAQGVLENGDHGVFEDVTFQQAVLNIQRGGLRVFGTYFVGFLAGFVVGLAIDLASFIFYAALPDACPAGNTALQCFKFSFSVQEILAIEFSNQLSALALGLGTALCTATFGIGFGSYCVGGFILGLAAATNIFTVASLVAFGAYQADPPLSPALITGTIPPAPAPGSTPGLTVSLVADTVFSVPLGNAPLATEDVQLPTVFDALITNTGPAADTFNLALLNPPAGFSLVGSLPTITVPAGAQGEITVCAVPTGTLPAPGTNASFGLSAASATNNSVNASTTVNFTVPSVSGLVLGVPASVSTTAGASLQETLQIQGAGNVASTATLTVTADPNLTVTGLQTPVTVNPGQTVSETLTIAVASGAPLNTPLNITIVASYGTSQSSTALIAVTVYAQQALTAVNAASAAAAAGRSDIAATLSGLGGAINALVAGCTSATLLGVQNYAQNLFTQTNSSSFFQTALIVNGNAFNDIANATCSTYAQPLSELTAFTAFLNTLFTSPAAYPFQFAITPVSVVAQPNSTSTFKLQLQNQSQVTQTYNLTVSGIPAGLGGLNTASVTLAPQQAVPAGVPSDPAVVISQTGATLQSFSFAVVATPTSVLGASQTASATVNLRPDVLDVEAVTAIPGFVNAGGSVDVQAHIANAVNQPTPIQATLQVLSASNQVIATAGPVQTALSVADLTATIDFGQIAIPAGTANGNYTLSVSITDASGNPLTGGTGTGFLLVGSPVTASLTVSPSTVPAGNSTVLNTLTVTPTGGNAGALTLVGSVNTASSAQTVALNGNTAYVCDQNEVSVVDVTNPAAPAVLTTALSTYIANAANIHCNIQQGDLVIFSDTSSTTIGNNPGFLVFGLSNPQSPVLLNAVSFDKRFVGDPILYLGNTAFLYTNAVTTQLGFETASYGDIVAVDVSTITNPQILGTLSVNGDPVYGGPNEFYGQALYNSSILFGASTTLTGTSNSGGAAALDVIDISNPASMTLSNQVTTSANGLQYLSAPLIQGNTLVALANSGATPNPESVVVYDISNPVSPVIVSTTLTGTFCCTGNGSVILGPNEFLFAGTQTTSGSTATPVLLLVNTLNPAAPVITPLSIPVATDDLVIQGDYLYAPTASGLSIYSIPGTALSSVITGYTATVQTSNAGVAAYDPTSFNVAPTKITTGAGFDTLEWDNPPVSTLTWNSTITGIQAGQIATVDRGGTVSFTSTLGNGTVDIGQVDVGGDQIISLSPSTQTYSGYPGAQYTVTVRNPTSASVTYYLTFAGITQVWLPAFPSPLFPSSVTVPAQGTVNLSLTLNPPLTLPSATYPFEVIATAAGISGMVGGTLTLINITPQQPTAPGPGPVYPDNASDLAFQVTPSPGSTGPGGTVIFQVQMTNVGPSSDTFSLSSFGNPSVGVARGTFGNSTPTIGSGQTFTDALAVQVPANAPAGPFQVTIFASGYNGGSSRTQVAIDVLNSGVALALSPGGGGLSPGTPAQLTVTNTGAAAGTFNLSLAGPGAQLITLPMTSVTLAAGANQQLAVTVGSPAFATEGNLPFSIAAQSTSQSTAAANVSSSIYVQSALGVTAVFQPASQPVPASGPAVFPLSVNNVGSVEDGYMAQITSATGQLTASLTNIDGTQTQTIADFQVPAQSLAQLNLNVTPTGTQGGAVVVTITSNSDPTVTATATATLGAATVPVVLPPNASALTGLTVPANRLALLNASASTDPNAPPLPLTFAWTLLTKPAGSALTSSSIGFPTAAVATFRPDIAGSYTFQVAVSNGSASANAIATYQAADLPPVAVVNQPFNVGTGTFAFLNGADSYDPDGQAISFAWTLLSAPAGSAVTSSAINIAQTPRPFFTPDLAGAYQLQLIVTDATASSSPAAVTLTAYSGTIPPNADAGQGINVGVGIPTALSGAKSSDPNVTPLPLSYRWTFGSTPMASALTNANISGATSVTPSFTPDVPGDFTLDLVVSNANGTSQTATVTVHAFSGNIPPNASAGANQFILPKGTVTLSSAASVDPDNGPLPLAYLWWLDSLPPASAATLVGPLTATPQFVADVSGYYIGRVEATDGLASGFSNTLVVSAAVCDADANGTVNATDIALIQASIGQTVLPNDPRDFYRTGTITSADVTACSNLIPQLQPAMPPVIGESFGAAFISMNGATSLSFTITNPNASVTVSGIAFTDSLPSGLIVASPNGLTGSCGGGAITAKPRSAAVSLAGAALSSGASCTFSVNVMGTDTGPQNNSVTVTSANGGTGNTSNASVTVQPAAPPPSGVTCPAISSGEVGVAFSSPPISVGGGTPPYTFSVVGTLPAGLTLNTSTGAITGTPSAPGVFAIRATDSTGVVLAGACSFSFNLTVLSEASFLVRYAANLNIGESYFDIANSDANGAPLLGPGFGATGNICVNVYAFDPREELISCCSCLVTPDQTVNLGANRDLTGNTFTGAIPSSITVKLLSTLAGGDGTGTSCTYSAATVTTATLTGGLAAWGTTLHATPTPGAYVSTEAPFTPSTLSAGELESIGGRCASFLAYGTYGICSSCRIGAL
ncbi:MAG: hypothetical protein ABSB15_20125 [Bryobacteraceae bacterium]